MSETDLCPVPNGHLLRADAAAAFIALNQAYAAQFGEPLCVTDSYRSYAAQVDLFQRKPSLAAKPGTSNHGWGVAIDTFCGVESYSSAQYQWLTASENSYGWQNPAWARRDGSRPEAWHWEFEPELLQ